MEKEATWDTMTKTARRDLLASIDRLPKLADKNWADLSRRVQREIAEAMVSANAEVVL